MAFLLGQIVGFSLLVFIVVKTVSYCIKGLK